MKLILICWLILTIAGPIWIVATGQVDLKSDYKTANRDSANLAPKPEDEKEAVIQAYSARAFNWRGIFGTHCWISVKPKDAVAYTVYQVVGWRTYRGLPALSISEDIPDRNWFNDPPELILDIRGSEAETLIPKIDMVAKNYSYAAPYVLWPGPNSNTFPAHVARSVPELELALPSDAIGKDFLSKGTFFAKAPSGTGYQVSLFGVLGILIAKKEGIEVNLLGFVYGIKFWPFKILLPGIG
ncbi:MAG: hypothetical protein K0R98_170 [Rickettsiaceae bacterium]|jgi:hypothetical protein|nr:hypothetical protein [Rickettsiaceae bacterium]